MRKEAIYFTQKILIAGRDTSKFPLLSGLLVLVCSNITVLIFIGNIISDLEIIQYGSLI